MSCIVKYEYKDGVKLPPHEVELWCGKPTTGFEWLFRDAQHAALSYKSICNECRGNIIKALRREC